MARSARRAAAALPRPRRHRGARRRPDVRRDPGPAVGRARRRDQGDRAGRGHLRQVPPARRSPGRTSRCCWPRRSSRRCCTRRPAWRPRRSSSGTQVMSLVSGAAQSAYAGLLGEPEPARVLRRLDAGRGARRPAPRLPARRARPGGADRPASRPCARSRGCSAGPSRGRSSRAGTASGPGWRPPARPVTATRCATMHRRLALLRELPVQRRDDPGQDRPGGGHGSTSPSWCPSELHHVFDLVVDEHARTVRELLCVTGQRRAARRRSPALARTLRTRDTYLLPLQLLQVQLLARVRDARAAGSTGRPAAATGAAAHRQRHRDRPAQHRLSQRPRRPTNYGF